MSLGLRVAKPGGPSAAALLLGQPGVAADPAVPTKWRALVGTATGDVAVEAVLDSIRLPALMSKAEKTLFAAVAADDVSKLSTMAADDGDVAAVARLLLGIRVAANEPRTAATALAEATADGAPPWDHRFMRRVFPDLRVCTLLAPGVPAVIPLGREAVVLLQAELLSTQGRYLDSVSILTAEPPTALLGLALAATYLAIGQNEAVVTLTDELTNIDDVTALCMVARGVAYRTTGRFDEALEAFDASLSDASRHPGMIVAALEERANLLRLVGDDLAAQADVERILALEGGVDMATLVEGCAEAGLATTTPAPVDEVALMTARNRVRRRIAGAGAPGTFGGRHHRTFQPEVEAMLAAGQFDAAEGLLLGLLDAVEDEAEELGVALDPTYFLTLIDLFTHRAARADQQAVRERYEAAVARHGVMEDVLDGGGEPLPAPERVGHLADRRSA